MAANPAAINAPIPGMSLTSEPGNRPWEAPPSMVTVEEAVEYYTQRILANTDAHDDLLEVMEAGYPVRNLANVINKTSVMEGKHSLDVGFLVLPVIEELLMAVADTYGARYIPSLEALEKKGKVSARQARLAYESAMEAKETKDKESLMVPVGNTTNKPRGLMAKPVAEDMGEE